jgi:hypothetical protein
MNPQNSSALRKTASLVIQGNATDVALLGIGTLVADLEEAERKFLELQAVRINESLDTGSHEDGDPTPPHLFGNINYNFAYQWNEEVKKFRNLIAQREGRRKAKDGEEENGEENGEEDNDNIFEGEE